MQIVQGGRTHLDAIVRLNRTVQDLHVENEPRYFLPFDVAGVREFIGGALNDPTVTFLLAVEGDQVLGYAMLRLHDREGHAYARPRRFAELEHIVVDPNARRRGVGAALIDEAFIVAKSVGVSGLELSVWDFNETAQRLFRRKGFRTHLHRMRTQVP